MNFIDKKYMYKFYAQEFSFENISLKRVKALYKKEGEKLVRPFLHHLISDWILANYQENDHFMVLLKRYLYKAKIVLNDLEEDQILTMQERIFSRFRHIKLLLVNTVLDKGEHAGAKFTNASLFCEGNLLTIGNLILTNKRIILEGTKNYSFYYDKVSKIKTSDEGLVIVDLKSYLITIHDAQTLINTFYNHHHKKVRKLV